MNTMITLILGWLAKVPLWVWLALAALGVIGWQHIEIEHYNAKVLSLQSAALTYQSAQRSQLATIAKLQAANKQWAATDAADLALGKTYADAAQQYAMQQQAQKQAAQTVIQRIYSHDPSARQWSVAKPPAFAANSLRANAGGTN